MTEPGDSTAHDPADPAGPDPEVAEEYAESVGVDPTHAEVDRYLELAGDEPLGDDPSGGGPGGG